MSKSKANSYVTCKWDDDEVSSIPISMIREPADRKLLKEGVPVVTYRWKNYGNRIFSGVVLNFGLAAKTNVRKRKQVEPPIAKRQREKPIASKIRNVRILSCGGGQENLSANSDDDDNDPLSVFVSDRAKKSKDRALRFPIPIFNSSASSPVSLPTPAITVSAATGPTVSTPTFAQTPPRRSLYDYC